MYYLYGVIDAQMDEVLLKSEVVTWEALVELIWNGC